MMIWEGREGRGRISISLNEFNEVGHVEGVCSARAVDAFNYDTQAEVKRD